jgi:hypothetical protein
LEGNSATYIYNEEPIDLELLGVWDWLDGMPDPLVIVSDHITDEIVTIVPARYGLYSDGQKIEFTLPAIGPNHYGIVLEVT